MRKSDAVKMGQCMARLSQDLPDAPIERIVELAEILRKLDSAAELKALLKLVKEPTDDPK